MHRKRNLQRRVLRELHLHLVRKIDHQLVRGRIVRGEVQTGGAHFGFGIRVTPHQESEMVDHGALGALGRSRPRLADDDKNAGQLHKLQRPGVRHFGAQYAYPQLLLRFGVGHHQMYVTQGDSAVVGGGQLAKH